MWRCSAGDVAEIVRGGEAVYLKRGCRDVCEEGGCERRSRREVSGDGETVFWENGDGVGEFVKAGREVRAGDAVDGVQENVEHSSGFGKRDDGVRIARLFVGHGS